MSKLPSENLQELRNRMNMQKAWVQALIERAQKDRWYGKLVMKFEKGEICHAVKEESLLPPTLRMK